jgi:hypothetical protein
MFTSEDPKTLAADLSRMTVKPVSVERAEELLSEHMAWLPQGEPLQCIAEDRTTEIQGPGVVHSMHRRTIVFRREGDRLQIIVEAALAGPDGTERSAGASTSRPTKPSVTSRRSGQGCQTRRVTQQIALEAFAEARSEHDAAVAPAARDTWALGLEAKWRRRLCEWLGRSDLDAQVETRAR